MLFFLQRVLNVPPDDSYRIVAGALLLVMPLFPALGALSDRIGRKPMMLAGNLSGGDRALSDLHDDGDVRGPAAAR